MRGAFGPLLIGDAMKRYECTQNQVWHKGQLFQKGHTVDKPDDEVFEHKCFRFLMDIGETSKSITEEENAEHDLEEYRQKNRIGKARAEAAYTKANATKTDHKMAILEQMVKEAKARKSVVGGN